MTELSGLTLAERILSRKAGARVRSGDLTLVDVDRVMVVDSIGPSVMAVLSDLGGEIRHPERVTVVMDHASPAPNVEVAASQRRLRQFARDRGLGLFDVGRGICHQVLIEERLARPGELVLGSDSHSTTYGAVAAFGTGMGATDIALAVASGRTWLQVPPTVRVLLRGRRPPGVAAKDVALEVVGRLTADGATYACVEYHGAEEWTLSERMTLANLAVEAGAKAGLVPPVGEALAGWTVPAWLQVDPEASYADTLEVDVGELSPRLSVPSRVDDVRPAAEFVGLPVDQVFVGTCTNGRADDLRTVAEILRGRRISDRVRLLVAPASSEVLAEAAADGTLQALLAAGATLLTPGCGPCMGRHMGVLAPGEVCVSTGNRNFIGRMGSPEARIFLASPAVAAASALAGAIAVPGGVLSEPAGAEVGHA